MDVEFVDKVFLPYEKKLRAQERLRKWLGVQEVERPTYERYITGEIERFDRRKNAFLALEPDNPYGEELRKRFKARTGHDHWWTPLPYGEMDPEDRIGMSLAQATRRTCFSYEPETFAPTPAEGRVEVTNPAWMSRLIKKVGMFLGADMVRITELDQRWVYKDIDIAHKYAIVVVVHHERTLNATAPSQYSWLSATDTYARLKFITTQLADFIAGMGYEAAYRETLGHKPEILMVPIAIDAGVGEFSRNARVMSPEYGINMRIKPVTTSMPLEVDRPISFGAHEFCMACENCATYCPPRAIPFGPPTEKPLSIHNNPGYTKWYLDAEKCLTFWSVNKRKWLSCGGRCISVCPWNHELNGLHNTVRWIAMHGPEPVKKLLIQMDRRLYHRTRVVRR